MKNAAQSHRMLFLVGHHGSGKTALAETAFKKGGAAVFDTGPLLRKQHQRENPYVDFKEWVASREAAHGPDFTNERLAACIGTALTKATVEHPLGVIIVGNRSVRGTQYLRDRLGASDSRIVYVYAPPEILYERYKTREGQPGLSQPAFEALCEADGHMGLGGLYLAADHLIYNDGSLEQAAQGLREYLGQWRPNSG